MSRQPDRPQPEDFLPLRPAIFLILLALADTTLHGYAIAKEVETRSEGRVRLATGPMYRHLKRLLEEGLVVESEDRPHPEDDDERRRYYRLTDLGTQVVSLEAERMAALVDATRSLRLREA